MYLMGIGLVLMLLKYLGIGFVAAWDWWLVLSPLAAAVVWWAWADWSGYTKRKAVERMDQRKQDRIDKSRAAMGLPPKRPR